MKIFLLALVFAIQSHDIFGQDSIAHSSLVNYEALTFHSSLERHHFHRLFKQEPDYLGLFLSSSSVPDSLFKVEVENRLKLHLQQYQNNRFQKKKSSKQLKEIFEKVHEAFFGQYALENHFYEVFQDRKYNCVSGTAIYAILFEEMGIPYEIKESPVHVYLIAKPENESILVETTLPKDGFQDFSDQFKKNFIEDLKRNKLIDATKTGAATINELFDEFYYQEESIDLRKLVDIQYWNEGVFFMEKAEYENALQVLRKAHFIYPNTKIGELLLAVTAITLERQSYEDIKMAARLASLERFYTFGIKESDIVDEFLRASSTYLEKNGDVKGYTQFYNTFIAHLEGESLKSACSYFFNYELALLKMQNLKYHEGLAYCKNAHDLKPENAQLQGVILQAVYHLLSTGTDLENALKTIAVQEKSFPFIQESEVVISAKLNAYVGLAALCFQEHNAPEGEKYLRIFESFHEKHSVKNLSNNKDWVAEAYRLASLYFFKRNRLDKAKDLRNRGMQYAPNNRYLLQLKSIF